MVAKLIGKDKMLQGDSSKKSGKPYHCQTMYFTHSKVGVEGQAVRQQFISFLDFPNALSFSVGDTITLDFDGEGTLLGVDLVTTTLSASASMGFTTKK
jgi:hypothetical protein